MTQAVKPMLAVTATDLKALPYPLLASVKLDGVRCLITEAGGQSRSGLPFPNPHANKLLASLPVGLDGELCVLDANGVPDFKKTGGALQRLTGEPKLVYYVFDLWNHPGDAGLRQQELAHHVRLPNRLPNWVQYHPQVLLASKDHVLVLFERSLRDGQEGLILKDPRALYKAGKNSGKNAIQWKVKPYEDAEAVVLSVFERMHNTNEATKDALGKTKRRNTKDAKEGTGLLGGFVCCTPEAWATFGYATAHYSLEDFEAAYESFLKTDTFEVAAGKMTHAEARKLWTIRLKLPERLIRFQHVPVGGYDKPRHGTFQGFREAWDMDPPKHEDEL